MALFTIYNQPAQKAEIIKITVTKRSTIACIFSGVVLANPKYILNINKHSTNGIVKTILSFVIEKALRKYLIILPPYLVAVSASLVCLLDFIILLRFLRLIKSTNASNLVI